MSTPPPAEIQAIVADLQAEIKRHRATLGQLPGADGPSPLAAVRQHQWVNSHLPIGWPVMPKGLGAKLIAYAQKITRQLLRWYINPIVEQQNAFNKAVADAMAALWVQSEEQAQRLAQLDAKFAHVQEEELAGLRAHVSQLQAGHDDLARWLDESRRAAAQSEEVARLRLQRLENWRRESIPAAPAAAPVPPPVAPVPQVDYFLLGALYRNEEQMRARLADYDDLFQALRVAQQEGRGPQGAVLDLGCGRGELVEHLQGLGLAAYGLDIDADAIRSGQEAGRDVRLEDATAHLQGLPDGSLAAITLLQVVEHFAVEELLAMLRLAQRKLAPGGMLLAETINPSCLFALSNWYLMDPSHRTPLHPQLLRFLLEQAGFAEVQIRFLHPVPERERLQNLPEAEEWARALNQNIAQLNHILYGPQDYAAIATRPDDTVAIATAGGIAP